MELVIKIHTKKQEGTNKRNNMAKVKFFKTHKDAIIPHYATKGAAGLDLSTIEDIEVWPGERCKVSTGLRIKISEGYEGQVRPRSGNALNKGITVLNTPGTIDCDYTGECNVILYNSSNDLVRFKKGDRIAQLIIAPVKQALIEEVFSADDLGITERGTGGFGSTGS